MLTCPSCGRENPDGSSFCSTCGAVLAATRAREVRKTVTVLFADVTGSTALGERLDPESLRRVMSRYFEEMKGVLERHGGTVEKFIGDAVMAVFGIPTLHARRPSQDGEVGSRPDHGVQKGVCHEIHPPLQAQSSPGRRGRSAPDRLG